MTTLKDKLLRLFWGENSNAKMAPKVRKLRCRIMRNDIKVKNWMSPLMLIPIYKIPSKDSEMAFIDI